MIRQIKIAPSLLAADPLNLGQEVAAIEKAGADWLHIDIMDGHFVPNLTYGPAIVQNLKRITSLPLDVHLMVTPVEAMITQFAQAGADSLTIHAEATSHSHRALQLIRSYGCLAGIALNPGTDSTAILPLLDMIDLVLIMTVNPGFGGQTFIPHCLEKIAAVRAMIDQQQRQILLEVDGGITGETCGAVIDAGADILVAGTAIFKSPSYAKTLAVLRGVPESA
ncbi:MAG: ribulose-phosphate 3-epimerase [Alphaproteobacteria bacterium]